MNGKINAGEIFNTVWSACDTFRGVIDPGQYKDYVLVMLFLKYVNDLNKEKREKYSRKYGGDEMRIDRAMQAERFVVPEESTFDYLYEHRNDKDLGSKIDVALSLLEESNREKLTGEGGSGVFRNISFNSSNLGREKEKIGRLKQLLTDFRALDLMPSHLESTDVIGDAYQFLIESFASDAGKKAGEFFTPKEVSQLLAELTRGKPGSTLYDPTCGSGSLLIKAAKMVGSRNTAIYGQENNGSTWALAMMNMFIHEFDNANIRWGDTIRNPLHKENSTTLKKFDVVVANPPFSLKKWGKDEADNDPFNRFWRGVPPKSRGDWAFVTHMIESAKEGSGKIGVVVPHGVLFRGSSEGKIRQQVIEGNLLEAVIGLPSNLFFGTGIPAAIMIFNKTRTSRTSTLNSPSPENPEDTRRVEGQKTSTNVIFIDASQEFESGTNQNKLRRKDIDHIVKTYEDFTAGKFDPGEVEDKFSYVATFDEIKENDFNLNIPRYVDTFEPESPVDMKAVKEEIDLLEDELAEVQKEMKGYLEKLDFN